MRCDGVPSSANEEDNNNDNIYGNLGDLDDDDEGDRTQARMPRAGDPCPHRVQVTPSPRAWPLLPGGSFKTVNATQLARMQLDDNNKQQQDESKNEENDSKDGSKDGSGSGVNDPPSEPPNDDAKKSS